MGIVEILLELCLSFSDNYDMGVHVLTSKAVEGVQESSVATLEYHDIVLASNLKTMYAMKRKPIMIKHE